MNPVNYFSSPSNEAPCVQTCAVWWDFQILYPKFTWPKNKDERFSRLCAETTIRSDIDQLKKDVHEVLALLERDFPVSLHVVVFHLLHHLHSSWKDLVLFTDFGCTHRSVSTHGLVGE